MSPAQEFEFYKNKFPDESAVYTRRSQVVNYAIVDDSLVTTIQVYEELMQLGENNVRHSTDQVYSSAFSRVSDLKAYTLVPKKKKYEKVEVTEFKESFDKDSYVFYDDTKEISFTYPAIQQGAKVVMQYTKTIKDPRLMNLFYFDTYVPVHEAKYRIEYDNNINLNAQVFNTNNLDIQVKDQQLNNNRVAKTFSATNINKIKFDSNSPSYKHLASFVYCPVKYYWLKNGKKVEVISTPENLHKWYRTFLDNLHENNDEVKALVDAIISPEDSVMDKVRKIYYWVQANIKYIAFEDGMRGLIPHPGNYVIKQRYGDCKDMSSTIVSMLREAGIEAHYTWVGTRDIPFRYSKTPSPVTDNHMIATFIHDGKTYFLDATAQYLPVYLPSSMIQGKECLISLSDNEFVIKEVPVIDKSENLMVDTVHITLKNNIVDGHGQVTLTGYAKVFNTYKLAKSNKKGVDNYVNRLLGKGNNKFQINTYTTSNVGIPEQPILIDYSFTIPDYYRQIGDKIYINLVLDKTMTDGFIENRTVPLENEYKYINRSVVRLTLPENFEVNRLPEDIENHNKNFGYKITYLATGNEIIVTKEFYEDYLILKPEEFEPWNKLIDEYAKACRKAIILSKKAANQ